MKTSVTATQDRFITLPCSREYCRGKYHCTINLLFDWFGIGHMTADNFCFYLQNRIIQTSQTGGLWYSDTSPLQYSLPAALLLSYADGNTALCREEGKAWSQFVKS
jgi:hypothetical protein